jgi:hypothetical protein
MPEPLGLGVVNVLQRVVDAAAPAEYVTGRMGQADGVLAILHRDALLVDRVQEHLVELLVGGIGVGETGRCGAQSRADGHGDDDCRHDVLGTHASLLSRTT